MSLSASLVDTPMYEAGHLTYPWIKFLGQVGEAAPALIYLTHAQRLADDPGSHADGTLVFERDTSQIYRVEYAPGQNPSARYVQIEIVRGAAALKHAGAIPKVASAGTLTESSLSDDGSTVTSAEPIDVTGDANVSGVYKVAGTQVVGARQADPGTNAIGASVTLSNTGLTANATYGSNEQNMLANLKAGLTAANNSILSLSAQVTNLITDRNNLRAILIAHGLMA